MLASWEPKGGDGSVQQTLCCICMAEGPSQDFYGVRVEIEGGGESWVICEACKDDFGDDADGAWIKAYIRMEERQRPIKAEWLRANPDLRTKYFDAGSALRAYTQQRLSS